MDLQLNPLELGGAAFLAWAGLRIEYWFRNRKAGRAEISRGQVVLPPSAVGVIRESAAPIRCSCGHLAKDAMLYEGKVAVCMPCSGQGALPLSCGHVSADGKAYPDGSLRCLPCAATHESHQGKRAKAERAYHQVEREKIEERRRAS